MTDGEVAAVAGAAPIRVTDMWFACDPSNPPDYATLLALPGFASDDDIVRIAFSSGTNGIPKAGAARFGVFQRRIANSAVVVLVGWERSLISFGLSVCGAYQQMPDATGTRSPARPL